MDWVEVQSCIHMCWLPAEYVAQSPNGLLQMSIFRNGKWPLRLSSNHFSSFW